MNSLNSLLELCLLRFCINSIDGIFSWFSSLFSLIHGARPKAFGCWAVLAFPAGSVAIPATPERDQGFRPAGLRGMGLDKKLGTSGSEVPRLLVLLKATLRNQAYFALTLATAGLSRTAWGAFWVGGA